MQSLQKEIQFLVDLYKAKQLEKAEITANKLIKANPRIALLYNILGLILSDQNKIEEAIKCYEHGLKVNPEFAMIYNNLGSIYKSRSEYSKAEEYYKKAIQYQSNMPEPYNNLGNLYRSTNRYDECETSYKKAIENNPKFYWAFYNLGIHLTNMGNFDEAKNAFNATIKINPKFYPAHRSLSRIKKYKTKEDEHIKLLLKLYNEIKTNNGGNSVDLSFALGKAHEDIKSFEKSFEFYKEGNFLQRQIIKFSISDEKYNFERIKNFFKVDLFNKLKNVGCMDKSPIFILGMPRSGTTLVEQIISSHNKVFGAGEIEFLPKILNLNLGKNYMESLTSEIINLDDKNLKEMGNEYVNKIKNISSNKSFITDKLPLNFLHIGFIKLMLPNSKIIHCKRNSKDNILSIFKNHFPYSKISYAYDLKEIVEYYNLYEDLMTHWNVVLPNQIFSICYEDLINNTENKIKELLANCNLEWDDNCLNFYKNKRAIVTASDAQIRNKINNKSINSWENYEKNLKEYFLNLKS
tara:strand:+ start:2852 stop:4414 length:1563 start_codon:yes stop_codon:yes gene_type:complete